MYPFLIISQCCVTFLNKSTTSLTGEPSIHCCFFYDSLTEIRASYRGSVNFRSSKLHFQFERSCVRFCRNNLRRYCYPNYLELLISVFWQEHGQLQLCSFPLSVPSWASFNLLERRFKINSKSAMEFHYSSILTLVSFDGSFQRVLVPFYFICHRILRTEWK